MQNGIFYTNQAAQDLFIKQIEPLLNIEHTLPDSYKRHHGTGGDFLEHLLGKKIDNVSSPDLFNKIELKTKLESSSSLISLITKAPNNGNLLRTEYGKTAINDNDGLPYKRLNATIRYSNFIKSKNPYTFKLNFDEQEERLYILVKDSVSGIILDENRIYYNFADLQKVVDNKLKIVALVSFSKREENNKWIYKYKNFNIVNINTDLLLDLIKTDKIKLDVRMGMYKTGKNKGRLHDHGTGLRISAQDFLSLNN